MLNASIKQGMPNRPRRSRKIDGVNLGGALGASPTVPKEIRCGQDGEGRRPRLGVERRTHQIRPAAVIPVGRGAAAESSPGSRKGDGLPRPLMKGLLGGGGGGLGGCSAGSTGASRARRHGSRQVLPRGENARRFAWQPHLQQLRIATHARRQRTQTTTTQSTLAGPTGPY